MIGIDNNTKSSQSQSRIKLYAQSPSTSFAAIREIMTLGGRMDVPESRLDDLRDLIRCALELPADDAEMPLPPPRGPASNGELVDNISILPRGTMFYFDIAVGVKVPDIKFFLFARRCGRDDRSIARGVTSWMESRGRGEFCPNFLPALESIAQHRPLDQRTGIQTYIGFLITPSEELDVTSYLSPEALHPQSVRFLI